MSNELNDKFKTIFICITASLDLLVCLAKTRLNFYVPRVLDKDRNS